MNDDVWRGGAIQWQLWKERMKNIFPSNSGQLNERHDGCQSRMWLCSCVFGWGIFQPKKKSVICRSRSQRNMPNVDRKQNERLVFLLFSLHIFRATHIIREEVFRTLQKYLSTSSVKSQKMVHADAVFYPRDSWCTWSPFHTTTETEREEKI